MLSRLFLLTLLCVVFFGCSDDAAPEEAGRPTLDLVTDDFTVGAGQERFLCWTQTLEQDMRIDRFDYAARPVVHHLLVSRSLVPVEDGLSECDVLFAPTWAPLFTAGNGDLALEAPEGASHDLPAGTQIVTQLHLLNLEDQDVTDRAVITMREAESSDQDNIGIFSFGTTDILLPGGASTTVANDCTLAPQAAPATDCIVEGLAPSCVRCVVGCSNVVTKCCGCWTVCCCAKTNC